MTSPIFELADRAVEAIADADPITATGVGIAGRDHLWTDLSPDGHAARRDLFASLRAEAAACPVEGPDETLAQRVMLDDLDERVERHEAGHHLHDLNNIASPFQAVHDVFALMSEPGAVATRLATMGGALAGYRTTLAEGAAHGDVASRRQVRAAIAQGRAWSGPDGFAVESARRAYAEMADWLERDYLPVAAEADGVGADRYRREARWHLGTDIDAVQTYAWGWSELDRLAARLREVAEVIAPGEPLATAMEVLHTDPARCAGSAEEFLELMAERQQTALAQLAGTHFAVDDRIRAIEVNAAPSGGALAPYYTAPSEDFSRPGVVWYPLDARVTFPLWEEVTTAHHEGFPGHHLQVGTQMALGDRLSRYHRRLVWKPGSGEGWALYAEHLMGELGYLDRPDYEAGLLAAQVFRSCRIVIDIGLHLGLRIPTPADGNAIGFHPGEAWTAELAVEMLQEWAFQSPAMARSEVVRYLGWPGQAITYKLGEKAILDLRAERQAAARPAGAAPYDPVAFHSDVLGAGAVGLDLLAEVVRRSAD